MDIERRPLTYILGDGQDLTGLLNNDINNNTRITVKTNCYKCEKEYIREEYLFISPNILILDSCKECVGFSETITLVGNDHK